MGKKEKKRSPFMIRLASWEYWPAWLTNIPVVFFWLYFALRARSLFFFNAANPAIETGGVMGESKIGILDQVPDAFKPLTLFVKANTSIEEICLALGQSGIHFPLIAKPNIGERGLGVEKLDSKEALQSYLRKVTVDIILQEFVSYPEEYSVLYYRFPDKTSGHITSLCHKVHLSLVGDGKRSMHELIEDYPRALLQKPALEKRMGDQLDEVLGKGEKRVLLPIGNHARGATFLDANDQIDAALLATFDQLQQKLHDIHICRFDLKCESLQSLKEGHSYKILEINGVLGEPAHIYDPNYSVRKAYRDLFQHWKKVYEISKWVHKSEGLPYMSFKEAWNSLTTHLKYLKAFKQGLAYDN